MTTTTMTKLAVLVAVATALLFSEWSGRSGAAPVSSYRRVVKGNAAEPSPPEPTKQLHVFEGYDPDELQNVNYSYMRPWQINKAVCPPILCTSIVTTTSPPAVGADRAVTVQKLLSKPGSPTEGTVVEVSSTVSAPTVVFPFLEADIVLDPGMDFIHPPMFRKQMEMRSRPTRPPARQHSSGGKKTPGTGNVSSTPSTGSGNDAGARSRRQKRAAVKRQTRLWPDGVVPYLIDKNLANETKESIKAAIIHFTNHTCIRFRPRTVNDTDYLFFIYQPGCWSSVGRTGGRQLISFGDGCEKFGIIVHEVTHALGFWHEQSRPDRDRYVKLIEQNVETGSLDQFAKREENETTTLGYAYDYNSIMHYGNNYYSTSEAHTLVPIGIGRKMNFRIGQRKKLSDIDIAQLNALYSCYTKEAQKQACREGWTKFRSSCYQFESSATEQRIFYRAAEECRKRQGQLLAINNKDEDDFIKNYMSKFHANDSENVMWLTAGLGLANRSVWYVRGSGGNDVPMTYIGDLSSADNQTSTVKPGDSVVLRRVTIEGGAYPLTNFVWETVSTEMQLLAANRTVYPFICEAKANITCHRGHGKAQRGEDYRGRLSYTIDGHACQRWTKRYPHDHNLITSNRTLDEHRGLGDHNHCRNPDGVRNKPWCFTLLKNVKWQYCDVPACDEMIA